MLKLPPHTRIFMAVAPVTEAQLLGLVRHDRRDARSEPILW